MELEDFFRDSRRNMYVAWALTALIASVFVESFLSLDWAWMILSGLVFGTVVLPSIYHRDPGVMVPWEVLALAAIPVGVRSIQYSIFTNQVAVFTGIAATALIIAVELHQFTSVSFNHSFAVLFTVVATLAIGGLFAVLRFASDTYLGTSYLTTNEALMKEFINILIAGIIGGALFDTYFRRRESVLNKVFRRLKR